MSFVGLKLYPMPVETIIGVAEAVNFLGDASLEEIAKFAGTGSTTAYKALVNASHLGFAKKESGKNYTYIHINPLKGKPSAEKRYLFQQLLQAYRPFEVLCQFCPIEYETHGSYNRLTFQTRIYSIIKLADN